jgi:hypothetical protein
MVVTLRLGHGAVGCRPPGGARAPLEGSRGARMWGGDEGATARGGPVLGAACRIRMMISMREPGGQPAGWSWRPRTAQLSAPISASLRLIIGRSVLFPRTCHKM